MEKDKQKQYLGYLVSLIIFGGLFYWLQSSTSEDSQRTSDLEKSLKNEKTIPIEAQYFEDEYMPHTVLLSYKHELDSISARKISYLYYMNQDAMSSFGKENISFVEVLLNEQSALELQNFIIIVSDSMNLSKKIVSDYVFDLRLALKEND